MGEARIRPTRSGAKAVIAAAVIALASGCTPAVQQSPTAAPPPPVSDSALAAQIGDAERIGAIIYRHDNAASRATDALMRFARDRPEVMQGLSGWITIDRGAFVLVRFVRSSGDKLLAAIDFEISSDINATIRGRTNGPTSELTETEAAMFRASRLPNSVPRLNCGPRINPVVLPGSYVGHSGLVVYALVAETTANVAQFGGHQVIYASSDGRTVERSMQLSNGCLAMNISAPPPLPPGTTTVGAFVTEVVAEAPTAIHVFISLLHKRRFFVASRRGTFAVEDGKIAPSR